MAQLVREKRKAGAEVQVISVGKKGRDSLLRYDPVIRAEFTKLPDSPTSYDVAPIARVLLDDYVQGQFDEVYAVYTDFVNTIKQVSRDMRVQESLKLTDGNSSTAIAVQRAYLKAAQGYFACHELNQVTKDVLVRWEDVLDRLEKDPRSLVRELDWVAKRYLIESYMDRKSCGWDDPRVRLMDLQYHDVRPEKGLYYTLERSHLIERIVLDHEIARAEMNPPVGTRAFFRGQCVRKYPNVVYGASWTSVLFDIGQNKIKKIPLMDPLRGTEALTGELLAQAETAAALLAKLSS